MATNEKMLLAHLKKKLLSDILLIWQICSAMSANDLINFWEQTILKWPFSGHFEFCNTYLTQDMQNDWTMNIKQNVMSQTRKTHDKFHTKKSKVAARGHFNFFFSVQKISHQEDIIALLTAFWKSTIFFKLFCKFVVIAHA